MVNKYAVEVTKIAQTFRKDGKGWVRYPAEIAKITGLNVRLVMRLLNFLKKERLVIVADTDPYVRGIGMRNDYSLTELGEKILLS